MKIVWSSKAAGALEECVDYISKDKPETAKKWAERVFNKIEGLLEFPNIGKIKNQSGRGALRQLVIEKDYLAVYRYTKDKCLIIAFKNTKQRNTGS